MHVKEAFPDAPVLKLGLSYPWPPEKLRELAAQCDKLVVVEETEKLLETELKAAGIACHGKDILPSLGELSPQVLTPAIDRLLGKPVPPPAPAAAPPKLFPRPPTCVRLLPAHGHVLHAVADQEPHHLRRHRLLHAGRRPPLERAGHHDLHGRHDGRGAGHRQGARRGRQEQAHPRRDRRFDLHAHGHAGPARHHLQPRQRHRAAARQQHHRHDRRPGDAGLGRDIHGKEAPRVDLFKIVEALGVPNERIKVVDPYELPVLFKTVREEIKIEGPSVIIAAAPAC
jgi:indolepyruvate ferredoxin oxidoreductase alpha subunit